MDERRFDEWNLKKQEIHNNAKTPSISEGEVWWCSVGENVGIEINGKGDAFVRPVVILRKYSKFGFFGIPLTSQYHNGTWYAKFEFRDRKQYAALSQGRSFSTFRLRRKMGTLPKSDLQIVKDGFKKLQKL